MDDLRKAIATTPIIDNHAHPLLRPAAYGKYPLLSITTEAHGEAMKATPSTLSHIRGVNQLAHVLGCPPNWDDVVKAIEVKREEPDNAWAKRCLEGIETILLDDGLDGRDEVFGSAWHDQLTRSKCRIIKRIEQVAAEIIDALLKEAATISDGFFTKFLDEFERTIQRAIHDPTIVGFKSIICYRTGLNIPASLSLDDVKKEFLCHISDHRSQGHTSFRRVDNLLLNAYLVIKLAELIQNSSNEHKKPIQFHTGLGDNDITLTRSSPSHLQEFIRKFPTVPIVLLHASYPWTKEAGYLASVYPNVYADIGEIFPFISKEGQEKVVREVLELCPSEKILWSTDGHYFPETYILAVTQIREALEVVLPEYVQQRSLTVAQAVKIVQDLLFNTSNDLYHLQLPLRPLALLDSYSTSSESDPELLTKFLQSNPSVKFLRMQYLDYTSTLRVRVMPVRQAFSQLKDQGYLSMTTPKAVLGLLQNDTPIPGVSSSGEYKLRGDFSSLRAGPANGYASIAGEMREADNTESLLCPRSLLRRTTETSRSEGLEFLVGFEIEVIFMSRLFSTKQNSQLIPLQNSNGHAWSISLSLHNPTILEVIEEIDDTLNKAGIHLMHFHAEGATGQYEFVLPPLPPLSAVDTLIQTREIIAVVAARHSLRATLHPKPYANHLGTAAHAHISISSPVGDHPKTYTSFYANILRHFRALAAFTNPHPTSYLRLVDSCWAGGRYVTWGHENKEAPLRQIKDSHWEMKNIDGLANPYLTLAAILAVGTKGVSEGTKMLWKDCQSDPATLSDSERKRLGIVEKLPGGLEEALEALEESQVLKEVVGTEILERYLGTKRAEIKFLAKMEDVEVREWVLDRY
ncbi:hypothetical protein B7494_g555 [Chlorociboria aeruginascens]|nr:hypothetical protein B7494_g555 [Chlorociboria aeruginascens]